MTSSNDVLIGKVKLALLTKSKENKVKFSSNLEKMIELNSSGQYEIHWHSMGKNMQNQSLCNITQYPSKHKFHLAKWLLQYIAKWIWLFWDIALSLLSFNKLGVMQPQPSTWHYIMGQQYIGSQRSDQRSMGRKSSIFLLEQNCQTKICLCITAYKSEDKVTCCYKDTLIITTLNRSILELEGTFREHMIQLFHFIDRKTETQSNWSTYDHIDLW